ncbi:Dolichyl-phosphate beta-D-mannosyltransferase [Planctopirus limnophila DSM 3776]|uniref:Dolichyl-phosphate beta-D-mannosyltransferase n=1 Tax=Planctopirus limnophila (strain ATCC 43296 / DSM 3776 / IFAM 1008 / Mu 290) TaxID=521674 RepID=D5SWW2_PLAL2|nr:polyprenol monophosphomannose synthase [Planctopirus limnophila]ADG67462.1 Dolichyl-phosphate beta-D-mannosyltransferase [Planctopirus limnophila DSM 3776]
MSNVHDAQILISICTYNEKENIQRLLPMIREVLPAAHIMVVDDNSPDGTAQVVRDLSQTDQHIELFLRLNKEGLGAAQLASFRKACESSFDYLINMDADFSHHPRYLPSLITAMGTADVVIGSRYVPGGGVQGWPRSRRLMSFLVNLYSRTLLGIKARDTSGAYRCYRLETLRQVPLDQVRSRGYAFQEEILFRLVRAGARVVEVPILFEDRQHGQSKINWKVALVALWDMFCVATERLSRQPVKQEISTQAE